MSLADTRSLLEELESLEERARTQPLSSVSELAGLLSAVREMTRITRATAFYLEATLAEIMRANTVVTSGFELTRRWSKPRKDWQHDLLAGALREKALERFRLDEGTGELLAGEIAATRLFLYSALPSWRLTAVRELGVDPDAYCDAGPAKPSITVVAL